MKQTHLIRFFSWLAIIAVVVTMAPPARSSDDYANLREVIDPLPELTRAAGVDVVRMATRASLTTATLGVSQVVADSHGLTGALSAPNEAPAIETPAVAHQEGALTPEAPPAAFGVAGEAAVDPDGREIELAEGRIRLALRQAAPAASVRYQPLAAEETGSPFGIGFELSTEHGEKLSPSSAITLTLGLPRPGYAIPGGGRKPAGAVHAAAGGRPGNPGVAAAGWPRRPDRQDGDRDGARRGALHAGHHGRQRRRQLHLAARRGDGRLPGQPGHGQRDRQLPLRRAAGQGWPRA
jgi:hypothetical protein